MSVAGRVGEMGILSIAGGSMNFYKCLPKSFGNIYKINDIYNLWSNH